MSQEEALQFSQLVYNLICGHLSDVATWPLIPHMKPLELLHYRDVALVVAVFGLCLKVQRLTLPRLLGSRFCFIYNFVKL